DQRYSMGVDGYGGWGSVPRGSGTWSTSTALGQGVRGAVADEDVAGTDTCTFLLPVLLTGGGRLCGLLGCGGADTDEWCSHVEDLSGSAVQSTDGTRVGGRDFHE